ncbi:MAG TPA: hypothetical protein VFR84_11025 [Candidatus Angelobacter sp.]|nr:hypothetical protein [Candidatus Angelobacter sp.]
MPSGKAFGITGLVLLLLSVLPVLLPISLPPRWDADIYGIIVVGTLPGSLITSVVAAMKHHKGWFLTAFFAVAYDAMLLAGLAV